MEFEAPSVWRIASKHTVTFHNLAALGLKRLAAILVDLAEVDSETPTGTRRRLGQSLEKTVWLSGAELKVRIQLPPAERCYGAGGEDGNFVAYINRLECRDVPAERFEQVPRCPGPR